MLRAGTLSDYQFMRRHTGSTKRAEKAKEAWGNSLNSLQDVYRVFTKYTSGDAPQPGCPHGDKSQSEYLRRHCLASFFLLASPSGKQPAGIATMFSALIS